MNGWVCRSSDGGEFPLDLFAACAYQYRTAVAQGWTMAAVWQRIADWNRIGCQGLHA